MAAGVRFELGQDVIGWLIYVGVLALGLWELLRRKLK
jgi:hypothetical protein